MVRRIQPSSDEESDELASNAAESAQEEQPAGKDDDFELSGDELNAEASEEEDAEGSDYDEPAPERTSLRTSGRSNPSRQVPPLPPPVPQSATSSGSFKVKLKMPPATPTSVSMSISPSASPEAEIRPVGRNRGQRTGSALLGSSVGKKRKRPDESENSEQEETRWSDGSEASSMNAARMTARQRAKEYGNDGRDELVSLPMIVDTKKKKVLTETEAALKRSEDTRKRKAQMDRKLEGEKQDTINRLLKKQTGRKGKDAKSNPATIGAASGMATPANGASAQNTMPILPTMIRFTSSIKTGDFVQTLSMPLGSEAKFSRLTDATKNTTYPGPRPKPPTRYFTKQQSRIAAV